MLSTTPKPYSSIIPSKDHKEAYMNILAWLMRGGWVTQLRTFAWIRVPSSILDTKDTKDTPIEDGERAANGDANGNVEHIDQGEQPVASLASSPNSTTTAIHITPNRKIQPIIIPNPRLANLEQAQQLSALSRHVHKVKGLENGKAWDACIKYFDGKHALESIATIQGWKKKKTTELFSSWEDMGILLKSRHW